MEAVSLYIVICFLRRIKKEIAKGIFDSKFFQVVSVTLLKFMVRIIYYF